MKYFKAYRRKINFKNTESSADTMLLTLILAGWFASAAVYLMMN